MRQVKSSIWALAIIACTGCSSSGNSGSTSSPRGALTQEAMLQTGHPSVFDAVQQLRPQWMTVRGAGRTGRPAEILVFVDGSMFGPINSLRQLQVNSVSTVNFLSATEAATRWGTLAGDGGVIEVRTR